MAAGRPGPRWDALASEARARGRELRLLPLDLAERTAWPAAWEALCAEPVAGLALVAGTSHDRGIQALEPADWDRVLDVNAGFNAGLLGRLGRPGALAPGARGILVGSIVGSRGNHGQTAYAASKGALLDLLASAPKGLRLNVLLPPLVESPLLAGLTDEARHRLFSARAMADPDPALSCAEAAAFLLGDASSYVHRQAFHADSRVGALGWD